MKYLGIDWGKRKIGLAIADGILAEPYGIIDNARPPASSPRLPQPSTGGQVAGEVGRGNWEMKISKICEENNIEKIVVGISEAQSGKEAKEFGVKLESLTEIPVEYFDETLTTHDALAKMKEAKSKRQDEDAVSAAIMLQNYLDSQIYV